MVTAGLKVYADLAQGTEEWYAARCGMLTASTVGKLLTSTLKVSDGKAAHDLTMALAAERITGHVEEGWTSAAMERGNLEEPLARDLYAEHTGSKVTQVGYMVRTFDSGQQLGYSPDGLIGKSGLIEIKSRNQKVQVQHTLADVVPSEHMAQIQAGLLVSGREWCDYVSYSNGMAMWIKEVEPDPEWAEAILAALNVFEANVATIQARYAEVTQDLPVAERVDIYAGLEF